MYDQLFSPAWIFDRCLEAEGAWLVRPIFILVVIILVFVIMTILLHKKLKSKGKAIMLSVFSGFGVFLLWFLGVFAGFSICSDNTLWRPITDAHTLHALMKEQKEITGSYPHNQQELAKLSPQLMNSIASQSKEIYIYDNTNNSYTWMIRPSKYYIVVFDTKRDYVLYNIPSLTPIIHWNDIAIFPPKYQGPWNKLPQ